MLLLGPSLSVPWSPDPLQVCVASLYSMLQLSSLHCFNELMAQTLTSVTNQLLIVTCLQTPPSYADPNVLNSYLVNRTASGAGNGQLTSLGQTWYRVPC